ncbi:amidohydrolase family protein [Sphingosinicella sp. BN140058]|uniref:amidohydrolase family protein n=1 Tax=Sphingosinicella sp. BN140058 TaxID=1892855 RepID=UPI001011D32F|nr:amidohydrolase family protein [Sphingosinicella sp. BN140058]QAY77691.1 amidohydrolase [Sphingosinicella sp. BN140058]
MKSSSLFAATLFVSTINSTAAPAAPLGETYTVIVGGRNVGHLDAVSEGATTRIVWDIKNNGRGPTIAETLSVDAAGIPVAWKVTGATTFGGKVDESFTARGKAARWTDSTGSGSGAIADPSLYVPQNGSPWALGLYARALLADADRQMPALPGGTLRLEKGETLTLRGAGGPVEATAYALSGINLNPEYFLLDEQGRLFAAIGGRGVTVRKGYEGEDQRLRDLAERMSAARYAEIQKSTAHVYSAPIRIRNVRLFDPKTLALTEPRSVLVWRDSIAAVEPLDSPATRGEVTIDGAGGTLVAGMTEMHGHVSEDDAVLNLAAGITTIRDMGNDNDELEAIIDRIESGRSAGSRIVPSGFIEGRSPFSSNNGIVAESEAEAVEAVRYYAARGYWQIKIYNSIDPAWVPAMVAEAHRLGLRVCGHVPAFSTADAMMEAGYDELTHINQFVLGWVLQPGEDTRNLLRLTALRRLKGLDLDAPKVRKTIDLIVSKKIAIDPTLVIHEAFTQTRNGQVPPGMADYLDHLPVAEQRGAKQAWVDLSAPGDDQAYRAAFDQIVATLRILNDKGVMIVPGTDMGGAFTYHRELELYQKIGMTPAQILKRATFDTAAYLGQDQRRGSIEKGKLADFFLIAGDPTRDLKAIKSIAMVVKNGTVYFPTEIYQRFGIAPFAEPPKVTVAASPSAQAPTS